MPNSSEGWTYQVVTRQSLFEPKKLSLAVSAALTLPAGAAIAQDQDQTEAASGGLEEVLVTARKRTESLMDIPQSIQAISANQIKRSGMQQMEDYVRFIPSMSYVQDNPGTAKIIFRGIADDAATFIAEPSAALYLDEQSLTMTGTHGGYRAGRGAERPARNALRRQFAVRHTPDRDQQAGSQRLRCQCRCHGEGRVR